MTFTPFQRVLAALLSCCVFGAPLHAEPQVQPDELPKRPSAEYFTTKPGAKVLVSVNIWGEVFQPGVHFVPVGAKLTDALGAAGGPTGLANMPNVRLVRDQTERYLDLFEQGGSYTVQDRDMIYVERTFKSDLPLIFAAVSSAVSVVTLYYVSKRK
jgi:protein involved in polysaccharide export with SLBB domain